MRNTLVAALSASILAGLSLVAIPSAAQSQVIIVVGNGSGQPYYPQPSGHRPGLAGFTRSSTTGAP